jgi:hypothetical protein
MSRSSAGCIGAERARRRSCAVQERQASDVAELSRQRAGNSSVPHVATVPHRHGARPAGTGETGEPASR